MAEIEGKIIRIMHIKRAQMESNLFIDKFKVSIVDNRYLKTLKAIINEKTFDVECRVDNIVVGDIGAYVHHGLTHLNNSPPETDEEQMVAFKSFMTYRVLLYVFECLDSNRPHSFDSPNPILIELMDPSDVNQEEVNRSLKFFDRIHPKDEQGVWSPEFQWVPDVD